VNSMEDRLREAYREAAETIQPHTIRGVNEQTIQISASGGRRKPGLPQRVLIPLAAAASVAIAAVLAAVIVPQALSSGRSGKSNHPVTSTARLMPTYVVSLSITASSSSLTVHRSATGAVVAHVKAPQPGMSFAYLATGDGRTYVAVLWRPAVCRSWLYRFTLNRAGQPGALTPYAVPSIGELIGPIAISEDNGTLAYLGENCSDPTGAAPSDLAALTVGTMRTRQWTIPKQADVSSLSLTANGGLLAFNIDATKLFHSAALVLPTNAPPGTVTERSRVVVRAAQFGPTENIGSDVITPDGSALYFTTYPTSLPSAEIWQLGVASLATGKSRIVQRVAGLPYPIAANPAVSELLILIQPTTVPSPSPSPSGPGAPSPSGPVASTPSPSPSGPWSPSPSPSGPWSPSPSPAGSGSPSPSPSSGQPNSPQLLRIDLDTGALTFLTSPAWQISTDSSFVW